MYRFGSDRNYTKVGLITNIGAKSFNAGDYNPNTHLFFINNDMANPWWSVNLTSLIGTSFTISATMCENCYDMAWVNGSFYGVNWPYLYVVNDATYVSVRYNITAASTTVPASNAVFDAVFSDTLNSLFISDNANSYLYEIKNFTSPNCHFYCWVWCS